MSIPLSEATFRLVDGKSYAVLATVNPGGSPQTSVAWAGRAAGTAKRTAARGLRRTRRRGTGLGVVVREPDATAARWMALDLAAPGYSVAVARVPGEPLPARTGAGRVVATHLIVSDLPEMPGHGGGLPDPVSPGSIVTP